MPCEVPGDTCRVRAPGSGAQQGDRCGRRALKLLDHLRSRRGLRRPLKEGGDTGGARGQGPVHPPLCAASPPPSILAHQVPNARKLKRKEQLWERLAKQGKLPGEVRRAQARLLNPPAARAQPGPQDSVQRPFYDLWAKGSECPRSRPSALGWAVILGGSLRVSLRVFGTVWRVEVAPCPRSCSAFQNGLMPVPRPWVFSAFWTLSTCSLPWRSKPFGV